ncbi:MAG: hypothetical protein IPK59_01040 [Rhodospirillaceae bacterium]|nr:hypothetical protein [Rhodospirillaceae bacterium]
MAKNSKTKTVTTYEGLGVKPWGLIVPVVLIGLIFMPSAAVVCAGMLPTLVARLVDSSPGRRLSITVGSLNLVGCLYFLNSIWAAGHSVGDIQIVLADSYGWLAALSGAGAGWVIFGAMPAIIGKIAETQTALRLRRITGDQERLVKEWGETVRGVYGVQVVPKEEGGE